MTLRINQSDFAPTAHRICVGAVLSYDTLIMTDSGDDLKIHLPIDGAKSNKDVDYLV